MLDGMKVMAEQVVVPNNYLLFMRCSGCAKFLVWEHYNVIIGFTSNCCEYVYDSIPSDVDGKTFVIFRSDKDMENITKIGNR